MADFCLNCMNDMLDRNDSERMYVLSKEETLCEGCAKFRRVVIGRREFPVLLDLYVVVRMIFRGTKWLYYRCFSKKIKKPKKSRKKD